MCCSRCIRFTVVFYRSHFGLEKESNIHLLDFHGSGACGSPHGFLLTPSYPAGQTMSAAEAKKKFIDQPLNEFMREVEDDFSRKVNMTPFKMVSRSRTTS